MFSIINEIILFHKTNKVELFFSLTGHFVLSVLLVICKNNVDKIENNYCMLLFTTIPFFSIFLIVPKVYDLFFSHKREILFAVRGRIIRLTIIDEILYMFLTCIFIMVVRLMGIIKSDRQCVAISIQLVLSIALFQMISIIMILLTKNLVSSYGFLLLYLVYSLMMLGAGNEFLGYLGYADKTVSQEYLGIYFLKISSCVIAIMIHIALKRINMKRK